MSGRESASGYFLIVEAMYISRPTITRPRTTPMMIKTALTRLSFFEKPDPLVSKATPRAPCYNSVIFTPPGITVVRSNCIFPGAAGLSASNRISTCPSRRIWPGFRTAPSVTLSRLT